MLRTRIINPWEVSPKCARFLLAVHEVDAKSYIVFIGYTADCWKKRTNERLEVANLSLREAGGSVQAYWSGGERDGARASSGGAAVACGSAATTAASATCSLLLWLMRLNRLKIYTKMLTKAIVTHYVCIVYVNEQVKQYVSVVWSLSCPTLCFPLPLHPSPHLHPKQNLALFTSGTITCTFVKFQ